MNKWQGIGRATKDIELRKTQSGKSVASFTLAVRRDKDNTDWIPCIAWNKTAELLSQYVHKGNRIGVSGRIQTRNYESNGQRVYVTEVVADEIEFLENKATSETRSEPQKQAQTSDSQQDEYSFGIEIDADDLPF
jgi:single-strand DNA-binding protein